MTSAVIDAGDDLPLTIPAMLRRQVGRYGNDTLLVCDDARLTYAEAEARSRILAKALIAAGAGKGSHVALLLPSCPEFMICVLAATRIGAVVLPFSTLSTPDELAWLLANSDTAFLFVAPEFRSHRYLESLKKALPDLNFSQPQRVRTAAAPWLRGIWFTPSLPEGAHSSWSVKALEESAGSVSDAFLEATENRVTPADRFFIIHTSGSTAKPKGVVHTQGSMLRYYDNLNQIRGYGPGDALYSPSPWFWLAGFGYALLSMFIVGGRLVASNATASSAILDLLERERPDAVNGWPSAGERLAIDPSFAGRDMSFIKRGNLYAIMAPGIKPRDPDLRHSVYGMTEAGSTITHAPHENDNPEGQRGSFGSVAPGYEAKIVDPETGKPLAEGQVGELWIRGTFMMEGYYNRHRSEVFERDGWFRTSDLGHLDADGFFYLRGRRGDMIKSAGANVAPREVEGALRELVGELLPCVVLGVPDAERGQLVVAVIAAERESDVNEAALREKLAIKLSSYKVPRRILRITPAELPLLSSGKVDPRRLLALVQQRLAAAAAPTP
jgi:acyl-CoA synthetase (AMP-forming)/AMP-acid ligase II